MNSPEFLNGVAFTLLEISESGNCELAGQTLCSFRQNLCLSVEECISVCVKILDNVTYQEVAEFWHVELSEYKEMSREWESSIIIAAESYSW